MFGSSDFMIHVCFCFRDETGRYSKFAGTAMLSLFENTNSKVTVHILHDKTLTAENRDKFFYIAGHYGQFVKFYNLDELCPDKIAEIIKLVPDVVKAKATVGAFYKLLIPQVLPKEIYKAIFVDPDTIVNLDINELWQTELDGKTLGAVPEIDNGANPNKSFLLCSEGRVKPNDYFNTGVMVMDLNILRDKEKIIMHGVKFRGENPKQKFFEQTVLNYCFSTQTLKLPLKFNFFIKNARGNKQIPGRNIYHYVGGSSRMGLEMDDPFNQLWMNYFIKTPWFNEYTIHRIYESLQKIRDDLKDSAIKVSTVLSNKSRAFFVEPKKLDSMKKLFSIQKQEEIILAENEGSLKKLIQAMKNAKDKSVFFILTEKFMNKNFPFDQLKQAGFTEGKNYLKAWTFLAEAKSTPFNSYSLIEQL